MSDTAHERLPEFLLTAGGPTYRLETWLGLNRRGNILRVFLSASLTWLPLLFLSVVQQNAIGHHVQISFVRDFAVHARFLLAVPLLLLSEEFLGLRLAHTARNFVDSGLICESDWGCYDDAVRKGLYWRDSTLAEVALYALSFAITLSVFFSTPIHVSTWYASRFGASMSLTLAGWWFIMFCIPLLQFLVLRWFWRLFLWAQFLWRICALPLNIMPTHPDQAGGLAFVGESERFFGVVLFAYSVVVSGVLANAIIYERIPLMHFLPAISIYVFVSVAVVVAPLLIFESMLRSSKRSGRYAYGTLALQYTRAFHGKWILGNRSPDEQLLGAGDIQSLGDLGNSFAFI
jgi:hypothetical protein